MKEPHSRYADGQLADGVKGYTPYPIDMRVYQNLPRESEDFSVPHVSTAKAENVRFFIANFDGTGNDLDGDPSHMTNVGWIHQQLRAHGATDIYRSEYVEGPGTQRNLVVRLFDGATGTTYDARLEAMYARLLDQARSWADENPGVEIRVIAVGFSRGAEEAAGFTRLVHERGVQDVDGLKHEDGGSHADVDTYTRPPIAAPGAVAQSVALFDPVGTGTPHKRDRHLASSVISGIQITARDERRNAFPSSQIIPLGMSEDGRFWNFEVPGSHSDIGGSYHEDGLAILNGNYVAQYINAHFSKPILELRDPPNDPTRYIIHHSDEHLWIYRTTIFDRDGQRARVGAQMSPPHCRFEVLCAPPDPMDPQFGPLRADLRPLSFRNDRAPEILYLEHVTAPYIHPLGAPDVGGARYDNHSFDLERHLSIGNMPVPSGYAAQIDGTPESSLQPVARSLVGDVAHNLQLLRDVGLINERVRRDLGPPSMSQPARSHEMARGHDKALEAQQDHEFSQAKEVNQAQPRPSTPPTAEKAKEERVSVEERPVKPTLPRTDDSPDRTERLEPASLDTVVASARLQDAALESIHEGAASDKSDYPPTDPRNESHRDHRLYHSIHGQLDALHAKEGIALNTTQMESLSLATLVTAKEHGLSAVTHVQFGQSPEGAVIPTIHAFEAFRGDLADPRTGWAGLTATDALKLSEAAVMQQLQDVNLAIDQRMAANEMDMSRQQGMGMSMSM